MNSSGDIQRVRVIVFGENVGARYRSGRSCRTLKRYFADLVDAAVLTPELFSQKLKSTTQPVWFIRAGCLPRDVSQWHLPTLSIGKPLCAFGQVSILQPQATPRCNGLLAEALKRPIARLGRECGEWKRLQSACGGDFNLVEKFSEQCPAIASVLLDASLVSEFAAQFARHQLVDAAIRGLISSCAPRCVRLAQIDVVDDAALRVAQAVTSLQRGGAERVALDLTRELPRYGVRTLFFALGSPTRTAFDKPEESVDFLPGRNRAEHIRNFADRAIAEGCDAVHAHLLSATDMAIVAEAGLPVIATVHNLRPGWPAGFANSAEGLRTTMLVACSQAVEHGLLAEKLNVPVRTVWNGIDASAFTHSIESERQAAAWRTSLRLAPNDFVFLSLANPRPQKRLERLPAVLAALRADLKSRGIARDVKLIVAGEVSRSNADAKRSAEMLRDEVERLKLGDSVSIIGAVENVAPLLMASDVLISVSEWEGLSLAHLEALAVGLPVVATDAGGTVEIARENSGLSVVQLDAGPEEIAAALANQIVDRENSDGIKTLRSPSSFTIQRMAERYASLYPRVIEGARGPRNGTGVWLIANNFSTGGAQSSARRLLIEMKIQGVVVRAAVLQEREDNLTPGVKALRAAGIAVFVPEPRSADPLDAVLQILERMDANPPRAILFWNVIAEHKILLADAILDIPIYDVSPGEMYFDSLDAYFARPRPGLPYCCAADYGARLAGVVVKYRGEAARAEASLKVRPQVIPNGMPSENLGAIKRERSTREARFVIGTSARLSPQKKLEELIEALRLAAPRLPPHVLKIAGRHESGGEAYVQRLKDLSADLCVEWVGEFQSPAAFLAGLDLFAMISEPAGCPNASLEAMAAGLPVIATDHGGASEQVIEGVTGRLVPRGDVHAFASALVALALDTELRETMGTAGRARIESHFSIQRMVANYRELCGV